MTPSGLSGGPGVLLRHARESGGVAPARMPLFLLMLARMTGATLGLKLELVLEALATSRDPGSPGVEPPVFILGHYRSGTTLLHKLLAADPYFGSVQTFDLVFPTCPLPLAAVVRAMLQKAADLGGLRQAFFHEYRVRLEDPNETEPLMLALASPWSAYWGYLFPRAAPAYLARYVCWPSDEVRKGWMEAYRCHLGRVSQRCGGRPLVVKDPLNTARVEALVELFPEAKHIHVVRDPVDVFLSMQALWRDVILPRYALQRVSASERDDIVLFHYRELMEGWEAQRDRIPREHLWETRYEDLIQDPLVYTFDAYRSLGLPLSSTSRESISSRWEQDRTYRPLRREAGQELPRPIRAELDGWRDRLGYRS